MTTGPGGSAGTGPPRIAVAAGLLALLVAAATALIPLLAR